VCTVYSMAVGRGSSSPATIAAQSPPPAAKLERKLAGGVEDVSSPCSQGSSSEFKGALEVSPFLPADTKGSTDGEEGSEVEEPRPSKCSNLQATANTVNLLLGMGSLSLPFAVKSAGWLPGLGLLLLVSMLSLLAARTLWRTLLLCDAAGMPSRTYVDVAEAALGNSAGALVTLLFLGDFLGACTCLVIVFVDNMQHILPNVEQNALLLIFVAAVLPTIWTSRLSKLSYLSLVGASSMVVLLCVLVIEGTAIVTGAVEVTSNASATGNAFLGHTHTRLFTSMGEFPISIGLILIVFGGHAAFPAVADSLHDKRDFGMVINVSFAIVATFYVAVAAIGYAMFGEQTQQEITLNLSDDVLGVVASLLIAINPLTTFGLLINSVSAAVERWLPPDGCGQDGRGRARAVKLDEELAMAHEESDPGADGAPSATGMAHVREWLTGCFVRTMLAMFCVMVAVIVPGFARVVAFVGSMFAGMLSGVLPSLFFIAIKGSKLLAWERATHFALVVAFATLAILGTCGAVFGGHTST